MIINIPRPGLRYIQSEEQRQNQVIESGFLQTWARGYDIEVPTSRIIMTSPDGTRYELTVTDAGVLGTNPV
jgi:hypothetical protein